MSESFRRVQATIPEPYQELGSLYRTAVTTKELVEDLAGQRGTVGSSAVTWDDLVRLGLIAKERVPKKFG